MTVHGDIEAAPGGTLPPIGDARSGIEPRSSR